MSVSLAPGRFEGILFIFGIQEFIHSKFMPVNLTFQLQMGSRTQNGDFLESSSNDFD
jgi:hypothetical protein